MTDTAPSDQTNKDAVFVINTTDTGARVPPRPRVGGTKNAHDKRKDRVESLFAKIGAGIYVMDRFDGLCIIDRAEEAAVALADLADENKAVAKVLDNLTLAGGYAAVFAVLISMVLPIAARHGMIPNQFSAPAIEMLAPESAKEEMAKMVARYEEMRLRQEQESNGGYPNG